MSNAKRAADPSAAAPAIPSAPVTMSAETFLILPNPAPPGAPPTVSLVLVAPGVMQAVAILGEADAGRIVDSLGKFLAHARGLRPATPADVAALHNGAGLPSTRPAEGFDRTEWRQ